MKDTQEIEMRIAQERARLQGDQHSELNITIELAKLLIANKWERTAALAQLAHAQKLISLLKTEQVAKSN